MAYHLLNKTCSWRHLELKQGSQRSVKSGNYQGLWKIPSFLDKIRDLSGNSGTVSGIFNCNQGIFRDEYARLFKFEYDICKCSPNLGWLWSPLFLNLLVWKLKLCLKYFLLLYWIEYVLSEFGKVFKLFVHVESVVLLDYRLLF